MAVPMVYSGSPYLFMVQRAIEESKKTALQEERARRYANRALQKTTLSAASTSDLDHENATSPAHQQPDVSVVKG